MKKVLTLVPVLLAATVVVTSASVMTFAAAKEDDAALNGLKTDVAYNVVTVKKRPIKYFNTATEAKSSLVAQKAFDEAQPKKLIEDTEPQEIKEKLKPIDKKILDKMDSKTLKSELRKQVKKIADFKKANTNPDIKIDYEPAFVSQVKTLYPDLENEVAVETTIGTPVKNLAANEIPSSWSVGSTRYTFTAIGYSSGDDKKYSIDSDVYWAWDTKRIWDIRPKTTGTTNAAGIAYLGLVDPVDYWTKPSNDTGNPNNTVHYYFRKAKFGYTPDNITIKTDSYGKFEKGIWKAGADAGLTWSPNWTKEWYPCLRYEVRVNGGYWIYEKSGNYY